jgi:hypothetical protein
MTPPLRFPVSLLLALAACVRVPPPDLGAPRAVDTGVSVTFGERKEGAPALEWDFGDGSPRQTAQAASHAFDRAGSYVVTARHDGRELSSVTLTATPRAFERALPATSGSALYLRRMDASLERAVDFAERAFGRGAGQRIVSGNPFVQLALELSTPAATGTAADPEEGLGVFTLPAFPGSIGLYGVTDGARALGLAVEVLSRDGGGPSWPGTDGSTRVRIADGREAALLLDRGYLYVALPELPKPPPEFADPPEDTPARDTGTNVTDFAPVVEAIRGSPAAGLEGTGLFAGVAPEAREGPVLLYSQVKQQGAATEQGAFASFSADKLRAAFTAHVRGKTLPAAAAVRHRLFEGAVPAGPVAVLGISVPPQDFVSFVFGEPGSEQRQRATVQAQGLGLPFEELLGAFTGEFAGLAWADVPEMFRRMGDPKSEEAGRPSPHGTAWLEAGLKDAAPVVVLLDALAGEPESGLERSQPAPETWKYRGKLGTRDASLQVTKDRARFELGRGVADRPTEELLARLRVKYGPAFLAEGHLSAAVDLGQLRREVDATTSVRGLSPVKLQLLKSFAAKVLDGLPPIDDVFLDAWGEEGGVRVRGRVDLREVSP